MKLCLLFFVVIHQGAHDRRYRDRAVVVPWTVLNRRLAVTTITMNIRHLHVNPVQHRNDAAPRETMQTLADGFVPFAPAMSKPPNVYSVFSTIAIMCCKYRSLRTVRMTTWRHLSSVSSSCYDCIVSWKRSKYSNAESERYEGRCRFL